MFTVGDLDPKSFLKTVNFMLASVLRVKSKQRSGQVPGTPPHDVDLADYIIVFEMLQQIPHREQGIEHLDLKGCGCWISR